MPKSSGKVSGLAVDRFCKYIHRYCYQPRLAGYEFCIRHILEDKTAPFRQCTYVHQPSKKRCSNAAPKTEKSERRDNTLCPFHSKKAIEKIKTSLIKKKVGDGPAGLLKSFEHFCSERNHDPAYDQHDGLAERYDNIPYADNGWPASFSSFSLGAEEKKEIPSLNTSRPSILDDTNAYITARDDPLRHAGVFTAKELVSMAQEKALRLQALYVKELNSLYLEHEENRRRYLKNAVANVGDLKLGPKDKKLKALMDYHKPKGLAKVFRRKVHMKRCELNGEPVEKRWCIFKEYGKCNSIALPLTKFCENHISLDPDQVLFSKCSKGRNRDCEMCVLSLESEGSVACERHSHFNLLSYKASEVAQELSPTDSTQEQEHFQSMDDIASLGLDVVTPGSLFGLDQFGEPGESTDTVLSEDQADLMQIQEIPLNSSTDGILCDDSRKSVSEEEK